MTKKKVVILGTGGNCIDILDTINEINKEAKNPIFDCIGFLDDDNLKWGKELYGIKILGPLNSAKEISDEAFFVNGIGSTRNFFLKPNIIAQTQIAIERFQTIIHPSAFVSAFSFVSNGTVIFQNVTVTTNVRIGTHTIILPNTVISHDDVINDFCTIAGGVCVSGNVKIENACYLGSNCSIKEGVCVGKNSLIGMGAVVIRDVPEGSVFVGVPARKIRSGVFLGGPSVIYPGVTIKDKTVVLPLSAVTKNFEGNYILAGTPAKVVKELPDDEIQQLIEKQLNLFDKF